MSTGHIRKAINNLGLLQLDYVNVLVPAHYLVMYSRLGAYDKQRFNKLVYQRGEFTEQWAHEASIVPIGHWPLLEHRRQSYRPWPNSPISKLKGKSAYLKQAIEIIAEKGAVTSQDLPPVKGPRRKPGDWHRSLPRWALEYHFGQGNLAVVERQPNFQRVYDLPERVIPDQHLQTRISKEDSQRELVRIAARAFGVATVKDLADYFRMTTRDTQPRLDELVEEGALREVSVDGWTEPAYWYRGAKKPAKASCCALLSPFDPLVWFRPRAERLFDFHYRIEIYVPQAKRKWGYYVLPFLLDDRIVARVDLKADRKNRCLLVLASHLEEQVDAERVADKLSDELMTLANWIDLEKIKVSRRGRFARNLANRCREKGYC